jgi:hypothetical protein
MGSGLVRHVIIDVKPRDQVVGEKILNTIKALCVEHYSRAIASGAVSLHECRSGLVYIYSRSGALYIDIVGDEEVFEALLDQLPREYLVIRLIERGFPESR